MSETEELGEAGGPELRDYGRTIWRYRRRIVVIALVAAVLAGVYSLIQTPVYQATAQLIIQPGGTIDANPDAQAAARSVSTEMAVLQSEPVQNAAEKRLGHVPSVTVSNSGANDVIDVSATSGTARQATADANIYAATYVALRRQQSLDDLAKTAQQLTAKITEINGSIPSLTRGSPALATAQQQLVALQQQLDQVQVSETLSQVGPASLLAPATIPKSPVSPKPVRNVAIALVLGLLIGVGLAFMRRYIGDTIVTREDLQWATDALPVLGEIPRLRGRDRDAVHAFVVKDAPTSPAAEGYRTLRTSIESLVLDRRLKYIQVTSAQGDDGKAFMLANLALALARSGVEVTIVCCDLRQPLIHEVLGMSNKIGFTSVLLGNATVQDALQRAKDEPNLAIISAGPPVPSPSELLTPGRVVDVISRIKQRSTAPSSSSLVLVDSAPVLRAVDALIVSRAVDATLLVASANSSSRRALQRSVQMLRHNNAPLIGTVLNNAE